MAVKCIECGDELLPERAELGYRYCTKKQCQAKHHRGVTITSIGVNKSADASQFLEKRLLGVHGHVSKKRSYGCTTAWGWLLGRSWNGRARTRLQ